MRALLYVTLASILLQSGSLLAQNGMTLIAHYPLQSTPNDTLGFYEPMNLINTPFTGGGIYSNGIYRDVNKPEGSAATTPTISGMDLDSFAISVRFRIEEAPPVANMPVFVGGTFYRWLGYMLSLDGTVTLLYNNGSFETSSMQYSLNAWHEGMIVYRDGSASLYLDDQFVTSVKISLDHGDNKNIGIEHGGQGTVYRGYLADLKVFTSTAPVGVEAEVRTIPDHIMLHQNYPNPFNPVTTIRFMLPETRHARLSVHNSLGQTVAVLIDDEFPAGDHEIPFDAAMLPSGVYFYRLLSGNFIGQKKLTILK